jgi:hypothetical protein
MGGECGRWLVQLCCRYGLWGLTTGCFPSHTLHFGFGALVLLGGFAGLKLTSTCHALSLARGKFGHFRSFPFPFAFRSTASLPCKMPLLLLGIIGLVAALLEFEEGHMTLPI